jgi:hypothetical protein
MSDKLTVKQIQFARAYAENGGDAIAAYKESYGKDGKQAKYLASAAYHKLSDPKIRGLIEEIQQAVRAQYILLAPEALENIVDLANHAENERVKLEANKEILYGAGLKAAEEVKLSGTGIFGNTTTDEIKEMIRQHLEEVDKVEEPSA